MAQVLCATIAKELVSVFMAKFSIKLGVVSSTSDSLIFYRVFSAYFISAGSANCNYYGSATPGMAPLPC